MITMRKLLITIGAAIAALALIGGPAVTATAAPVPVIYNYTAGWGDPAVRPHWVIIGQGGALMAHTWYWNTWNSKVAKSTGTLWTDNCIPNCAYGKWSYHKLYVTLSGVKWHNGRPYFSVMTWYTPGYRMGGYKTSTAVLHFSTQGGTVPGWH